MLYFCVCDLVNSIAPHFNHTKMTLPTGNLSNHINAVFTRQSAEVGDNCCCYDLLKKGTSNVGSVCGVNHYFKNTQVLFLASVDKVISTSVQYDHWGKDAPCWTIKWTHLLYQWKKKRGTAKQETYHYDFYRDGHRQLLSVAGIDFFDHNKNKERNQADQQLWHFSLRQQPTNIHQSLERRRVEERRMEQRQKVGNQCAQV